MQSQIMCHLKQWFSTLEVRRPTKDEYENFGGPPHSFLNLFYSLESLNLIELTYFVDLGGFMADTAEFKINVMYFVGVILI